MEGGLFFCAAGWFCRTPDNLSRFGELLHCLNCNRLAHEKCSEPLLLQTPCDLPLAISALDLDMPARDRLRLLAPYKQLQVVICVLCENRIKAVKAHGPP
jgi:hypothetical protein